VGCIYPGSIQKINSVKDLDNNPYIKLEKKLNINFYTKFSIAATYVSHEQLFLHFLDKTISIKKTNLKVSD
jgi:hypothetical protein